MKRKILYICPSSGIGGAETYLKATAKYHDSDQFENSYLLFDDGPLLEALNKSNVHHCEVLPFRPRLSKLGSHHKVARKIKSLIEKKNIDLVHSTMAYAALFAALPTRSKGAIHTWFQHGPASGWMDRLAGLLPHHAVFSNSNFTTQKQKALEAPVRYMIPKHRKILQMSLGTEDPSPSAEKKRREKIKLLAAQQWPEETTLVGMMCRIQKWKGVHLLLEALEILKSQNPSSKLKVAIWGEAFKKDTYFLELKAFAKAKNLPVSFMGPTTSPKDCLLACDALVNASIQPEPFGLSIIEAMSCKTTVIVPNEGGPLDIVSPGVDGLQFEARNPRSLSQNLQKLEDLPTRCQMQENGYQKFQTHFKASTMVSQLEHHYHQLIEPSR